jgi:hypothetical protein
MYAADKVENIKACTELANNPSVITGNGIKIGTSNANTDTTSSSAKMLPKRRKLNDKGLVKSSKTLIGSRIGVG